MEARDSCRTPPSFTRVHALEPAAALAVGAGADALQSGLHAAAAPARAASNYVRFTTSHWQRRQNGRQARGDRSGTSGCQGVRLPQARRGRTDEHILAIGSPRDAANRCRGRRRCRKPAVAIVRSWRGGEGNRSKTCANVGPARTNQAALGMGACTLLLVCIGIHS